MLIGEACRKALELVAEHGGAPKYGHHYLGYLDLVSRALARLRERRPEVADMALKTCGFREWIPRLERFERLDTTVLKRLRSLST